MARILDLRNEIIKNLGEKYDMTWVEVNGNYFAAADIAIKDKEGNLEIYRISVVKCNQL